MNIFTQWLRDESGHDLIEYALLAATVGIGCAVALGLFPGVMSAVYQSWVGGTENIWQPCDPGVARSCH